MKGNLVSVLSGDRGDHLVEAASAGLAQKPAN